MRLHVLGNGCPHPLPGWYGSSFILETGPDLLMVDCGPATTSKMACMGISTLRVGHVFFTHHHFDHNVDFPCFALTRWDQSRGTEPPLKVYGPPPTRAWVGRLLDTGGAFFEDWQSRVRHPASHEVHRQRGGVLPRPAPAVEAADLESGQQVRCGGWLATAQRVHHVEPWLESLAYRIETDEGSVAFAGDCGDCPELRSFAGGADTLVIACAHAGRTRTNAAIADVITGVEEAAEVARESGARRVVLTHASPGMTAPERRQQAIDEVARACGGVVLFPPELTTVDLSAS